MESQVVVQLCREIGTLFSDQRYNHTTFGKIALCCFMFVLCFQYIVYSVPAFVSEFVVKFFLAAMQRQKELCP